jgi:hypothetical protein
VRSGALDCRVCLAVRQLRLSCPLTNPTPGSTLSLSLSFSHTHIATPLLRLYRRFISGFYFLHAIGTVAEVGFSQINRQDIAGWSFYNRPSQYGLAGGPGWIDGPLMPNPDWFLAILWKQM